MTDSPARSRTATALRRSAVAQYLQLAALFRRRIDSGQWPVDQQIPTVEDLARECGVASMTIRKALDLLHDEGLIERFRAKGTFVRKSNRRDLWCEVQTDWNGLLLSRDGAQIEVLSQHLPAIPPDPPLDVGALAPAYHHFRRLHRRHGRAFLLADLYIDEALVQKIDPAEFSRKTAMRLVADVPGLRIVDARQILTIGSADPEISELLGIALGDPVAHVQRIAVAADGTLALIANGVYRGDMVRVDIKLLT